MTQEETNNKINIRNIWHVNFVAKYFQVNIFPCQIHVIFAALRHRCIMEDVAKLGRPLYIAKLGRPLDQSAQADRKDHRELLGREDQ